MPKETFFNLPEDKRSQIFQAAVNEFATYPFAQASINRIVRHAGIAKGSFYQYFENKKDLFFHVLMRIGEEKMAFLAPILQRAHESDFFTLLRELYAQGLRFAVEHPKYAEIGKKLLASKGTPIFDEVMIYSMPTATSFFEDLLQRAIQRGEVRADVHVKMLSYLIASLNTLVLEYYTEHVAQDYDIKMLDTVDQFLDFLRRGIGAENRG